MLKLLSMYIHLSCTSKKMNEENRTEKQNFMTHSSGILLHNLAKQCLVEHCNRHRASLVNMVRVMERLKEQLHILLVYFHSHIFQQRSEGLNFTVPITILVKVSKDWLDLIPVREKL